MDEDLLQFIKGAIHSVWALETLLFMREHGYRAWDSRDLARELRSNDGIARGVLSALEAAGLVSQQRGGFVYRPGSQELEEVVDRLAVAYTERPVTVVNAIVEAWTEAVSALPGAFLLK